MVETYNMIIMRNARLYGAAQGNSLVAPTFYGFMGVLFIGYSLFNGEGFISFLSLMGYGFLAFGVFCYRANRKVFGGSRNVP